MSRYSDMISYWNNKDPCEKFDLGINSRTNCAYRPSLQDQKDYRVNAMVCGEGSDVAKCLIFKRFPTLNPETGRKIASNSRIYQKLVQQCGAPSQERSEPRARVARSGSPKPVRVRRTKRSVRACSPVRSRSRSRSRSPVRVRRARSPMRARSRSRS
jgi:hypothetical protein